ncbi:MAG: hypothetical protein KBA64_02030 [Armatimonadetes bacterium]|nr:hypothetical protein [Armatimonadota bacterium]
MPTWRGVHPTETGTDSAVRGRPQTHNPHTHTWTKRDTDSGRFMQQKDDGKPFKGVRREK